MSWATRRRFLVLLIVGATLAAFAAIVLIATFYQAPTCTDNTQNQGEAGIDCGGPCPYLCTDQVQPPIVLFTKAIPNGVGRTDVVAEVENKNLTAAAKAVPYHLMLYGVDHAFLKEVDGTLELPPGATVPLFIPNILSGQQTGASAFLTIDPAAVSWFTLPTDPRILPVISNTVLGGTTDAPRIQAVLSNPTTTTFSGMAVAVLVHDASGNVLAASQTLIPSIAAQGQATASFTWNSAFPGVPTAIEIVPLTPLP